MDVLPALGDRMIGVAAVSITRRALPVDDRIQSCGRTGAVDRAMQSTGQRVGPENNKSLFASFCASLAER